MSDHALKIIDMMPASLGSALSLGKAHREVADDILENGTVYCLKHCLSAGEIDAVRNSLQAHYAPIAQTKIQYSGPTYSQNYHSIEKGVSPIQKTLHYFHAYVFNDIESLPIMLKPSVSALFTSLITLYNELTGQQRPLIGRHADGRQFRPQIFQYPRGGGMFAAHVHELEPQKIGFILGCSKRGRDFQQGGAGFQLPSGEVIDTTRAHDIGDIVLFRYDLKHWVTPCDITAPMHEADADGRWSAVMPLY